MVCQATYIWLKVITWYMPQAGLGSRNNAQVLSEVCHFNITVTSKALKKSNLLIQQPAQL